MYEKKSPRGQGVAKRALGLLDLLVSHLDFTVDDESWEP
jgi:hypothetical protein